MTDELEFNEEAEILFDLFCEELDTRKSLEAADGVKITQKEWSFFIVHCSDLHVFSFCLHSFKGFKILPSFFCLYCLSLFSIYETVTVGQLVYLMFRVS